MTHTITLPDQTTFTANDGETVLAAAARQNLNLPHSCKSGACGQCKAELVSGDIQMGEHSEQALSEAEKAQGKILMCCTTAQSDISITVIKIMLLFNQARSTESTADIAANLGSHTD